MFQLNGALEKILPLMFGNIHWVIAVLALIIVGVVVYYQIKNYNPNTLHKLIAEQAQENTKRLGEQAKEHSERLTQIAKEHAERLQQQNQIHNVQIQDLVDNNTRERREQFEQTTAFFTSQSDRFTEKLQEQSDRTLEALQANTRVTASTEHTLLDFREFLQNSSKQMSLDISSQLSRYALEEDRRFSSLETEVRKIKS